MRPLGLAVALGGIGALVLAAPALRGHVLPPDTVGPGGELPLAMAAAGEAREAVPPPSPAAVRPVAPEIVAPPPVEPGGLERIVPREPLGPIGRAHVPSEGPPKETVLHRPLATQAGAFAAMGYRVVLAGLRPTPEDETCVSGGVSWPCGIHARTAFRNWLRGRALACVVPPAPPTGPFAGPSAAAVVTPCRLGRLDAGEWLVAQGWARADPDDGRYAALEEEARAAGRGLHGRAPALVAPLSVTVPELTEEELADPGDTAASGG